MCDSKAGAVSGKKTRMENYSTHIITTEKLLIAIQCTLLFYLHEAFAFLNICTCHSGCLIMGKIVAGKLPECL